MSTSLHFVNFNVLLEKTFRPQRLHKGSNSRFNRRTADYLPENLEPKDPVGQDAIDFLFEEDPSRKNPPKRSQYWKKHNIEILGGDVFVYRAQTRATKV